MNIYTSLIIIGSLAVALSAYLPFQVADRHLSFILTISTTVISLCLTFFITKKWLEKKFNDEIHGIREGYEKKIRRLKREHDTTTLEKTIRDGTQALIKNAVDYFKLENIKSETGATAAIQNLQLDKYGQIIELLADFSLILPDYQENRKIVQQEIDHKIEVYTIDEKPFATFLQRILEKYEVTLNKKIREKKDRHLLESIKSCPRCAEKVMTQARVCKHCGYKFKGAPKTPMHSTLALERVEKGKSLFTSGNFQEALNVFSSAIELKPNYATAYYNRAIVFNKLGNRDAAEQDLKEAAYLGHKKARELLRLKGMQ